MESIDIFYRIFHEDLNPLTNQKSKEFYINYLNPQDENINIRDYSQQELKFLYYKLLLLNTQKKVKRELHEKVYVSGASSIETQDLVQKYQSLLLTYSRMIEDNYLPFGKLLSKFQLSDKRDDTDIFRMIYDCIDGLLNYLEELFYKYLDQSLSIPYQQKLWFVLKKKKLASILLGEINKLSIPEDFKRIIVEPFDLVIKNQIVYLTYEGREYLFTYFKVFKNLFKKDPTPSLEMISNILISLDYNKFGIFFFLIQQFKDIIQENESNKEKFLALYRLEKQITTITVTSNIKYNTNLPSLKEQLQFWIKEEIKHLEKESKVSISVIDENVISDSVNQKKKMVHMSVSELSIFIRVLYESGVLKESRKAFFEFISETFRTKKAESISTESIKNRYYAVSENTRLSVEGKLKKMLIAVQNIE